MNSKDFLDNTIKIGDEVIYMRLNYRELARGIITKITNKTVYIMAGLRYISAK